MQIDESDRGQAEAAFLATLLAVQPCDRAGVLLEIKAVLSAGSAAGAVESTAVADRVEVSSFIGEPQ